MRVTLTTLFASIVLTGVVRGQDPDYVKKNADFARSRNEMARTVSVIGEMGSVVMSNFDDDLELNSVLLVTTTGRNVVLNLGSSIATWHRLTIDETLAQRPVPSDHCIGKIRNAPSPIANEIGTTVRFFSKQNMPRIPARFERFRTFEEPSGITRVPRHRVDAIHRYADGLWMPPLSRAARTFHACQR